MRPAWRLWSRCLKGPLERRNWPTIATGSHIPSATIDFHIDLELGSFTEWADTNSYNISPEDSTKSLAGINLKVVATGTEPAQAIMDLKGSRALVHLETQAQQERIGVYEIAPAAPAMLEQLCLLPTAAMSSEVQSWFHRTNFLWAQFARSGEFVVLAHTGGLAAFDLRNPTAITVTTFTLPGATYPSRLAVDQDQQHVYVSFRKTGLDLGVYRLNADGSFSEVTTRNDINHTIAGLVPAPGGGVIVHAVSGIRNDSHGYKRYAIDPSTTYFVDADDLQDEGGDRFGNSNTLLKYAWINGQLQPESICELAGELSESQMAKVSERHQSSMFCFFDSRILLSKGRNPFAVSMDAAGMFENPAWLNSKDGQFHKYWVTDLRGLDAGSCYISSKINSRINKGFLKAYSTNEATLSPFNAFTRQQGPLTCSDQWLVSADLFLFSTNGGTYVLTRGRATTFKEYDEISDAAPLALVDLHFTATKELAPVFSGVLAMPSPTTIGAYTFLGNSNRVATGASDTSMGGNDLYVMGLIDPQSPQVEAHFGGELYLTHDLLYVESRKLLFAINAYASTIDVYQMQNPASPVLVTNLPAIVRSLAWSEKRQQLYATASSSILIFTLDNDGRFAAQTELFSTAGVIKKIAYNDELDLAIASAEPTWTSTGNRELLVLDFQHAAFDQSQCRPYHACRTLDSPGARVLHICERRRPEQGRKSRLCRDPQQESVYGSLPVRSLQPAGAGGNRLRL